MAREQSKPVIIITGSAGNVGTSLREKLADSYAVVGMDRHEDECEIFIDLSSDDAVRLAFRKFRELYGGSIAACGTPCLVF